MDRFPKMLYRFPGVAPDAVALQDGKYDLHQVDGEEAHDAALAEGWSETAAEARAAGTPKLVTAKLQASPDAGPGPDAGDDDTRPPTRDEWKAKAKELGLTFAHNITTDKLAELVTAKLQA